MIKKTLLLTLISLFGLITSTSSVSAAPLAKNDSLVIIQAEEETEESGKCGEGEEDESGKCGDGKEEGSKCGEDKCGAGKCG